MPLFRVTTRLWPSWLGPPARGRCRHVRTASDHLRRRVALDESSAIIDKTCDPTDAVRRAEAYNDGNVNVALVLRQIGAELAT